MLAWMLYVIMVTTLLSIGAYVAERAARLRRGGTRWIWIAAIAASLLIPTVIASVSVELPNVLSPRMAQKAVVLRDATTQALSPMFWISGSAAEPAGWRDHDAWLKNLWRGASAAMLSALVASGVMLFLRKRRWRRGTVSNADVYVTEDVGPAVVGLLRPRIVVPRWVTMALPSQQSAVIAHEQSHLDARDPQLFTFALALLVFMPWNLPLWWQLRRLRYAIEVDCDARVIRGGVDPAHYGETLITVGARQSAYIGAVAAMSESPSFLEERIRLMIRKPVKWRRLGVATLASLSLGLTALAAQVSPPNSSAPTSAKPGERVAITLPPATLDRYVGAYRLDGQTYFDVTRDGSKLMIRITGQPAFEVFPERENYFFWKVVDAQIEFASDGSGGATLYQWGQQFPLTRSDAGSAAQAQSTLDARIASQSATPGSEAALRHFLEGAANGRIDYSRMDDALAAITRKQESQIFALTSQLGAVQSVRFVGVGSQGWDVYEIKFANGTLQYRVAMSANGRMGGLMGMTVP